MDELNMQQVCDFIAASAPGGKLASDSRRITPGDVFFAYPGDAGDGRAYIARAIEQGAAAVVYDGAGFTWQPAWTVPHLAVAGLKKNAGAIAHACHGMPDSAMFTVGVTGTNGKTSCAVWLGQAFARLGETAAVIGTLGVGLFKGRGEPEFDATGYTTPDAVLLAQTLAEVREAGASTLAIEVSSIGLDQGRTSGMHFDVALFTNLTRDHLDYHGDMQRYEAAKQKLFEWPGLKTAVLNLDDPAGLRLVGHLQTRFGNTLPLIGYTLRDELAQPAIDGVAILRASQFKSRHSGTEFHLESPQGAATVKTQLVGHFNVSNALAVLGALLAKKVELRAALDAIESLTPAPGRMQQLGGQDAPMVVIDYAHTPDALQKTLEALRQVAQERGGELWCVFGCGGDRDPGKRPQMGAISQIAGHVLVTSDNPRSEEPAAIIAQIVGGMDASHPTSTFQTNEDRAGAILWAVRHAARADVILLAGKGHEPYQEIKGRKMAFSDADHAALALAARATMKRTN
ncbi:UDP-N-acetylmuramoyl-L-alanyl-D-glutamate--2,6-diaminopimelate ligase [Massilia sp. PAMC28688]|uniref:UDP-N-acetylmuramoyl-L-alanyl-D-glutamate--2, 6-diaminopimelate ligase n=1 Tax=Massilia sp. PAMC28688 TaxID=2861283 RepID=UPI001C62DBCB|nr:UDP-N-acetylmuramoyl-L-alanyl-D-glutamate--2,6-diaminopimelate ligase [Massilia sp. PAMC28688]QYF94381.1 UDP-N-acetylmuramoyl-L-alanyl-D-glutamate--2,6-diaminopimelate ligase [Massilia sp. PAMC28688]